MVSRYTPERVELQISENNFLFQEDMPYGEEYARTFTQKYFRLTQALCPGFFDAKDPETQDNIIRNNFGSKIDINSFKERATSLKMTPQTFTFFLHIAAHMAVDTYNAVSFTVQAEEERIKELHAQEKKRDSKKKKKGTKKSTKKSTKKPKRRIIPDSEDSDDSIDKEIMQRLQDDGILSDDDQHSHTDDVDEVMDTGTIINVDDLQVTPDIISNVVPTQPQQQQTIIIDAETSQKQQDPLPINEKINLTKTSKKNKSKKNDFTKVLTGHIPDGDGTPRVRDILVYDIPASWTAEQILAQLNLWGKTISITSKRQRKYQTLRVKIELSSFRLAQFEGKDDPNPVWTTDLGGIPVRWFPSRWTLKERKQREKFQATIRNIPETMTLAALWKNQHPHQFLSSTKGLKSFKIIQTARGDRKLIGYFEKWEDMQNALNNQFVWEQKQLSWNRHDTPSQRTTSQGKNTKKKERVSRNQKSNGQNSKDSKKKPSETKSKKSKNTKTKDKKDKSRKTSRSKIFAELLEVFCKLI